jgi:hypothetical protein
MATVRPNLLERATIRNARVCASTENYGYFVNFNEEFNTKGWEGGNVSVFGSSGGFLFMTATTQQPHIFKTTGFAPVDASINTEVLVRYKIVRNRSDSIADRGVVQFQTTGDATWSEEKQLEFDVILDGKWHQYNLNFGPVSTWVGLISNLRIYFATNCAPSDEIFVNEIRIQSPIFSFCIENCLDENSATLIGQFFDNETIGNIPVNWSISQVDTDRRALIDLDPNFRTSNSKSARLQNSSTTVPGPKMSRSVSPHSQGYLSCKLLTTTLGTGSQIVGKLSGVISIISGLPIWEISFYTDGFIKYRQGASYVDFEAPVEFSLNTWHDILIIYNSLTNLSEMYIDGNLVGTSIPYVFSGLMGGVVVEQGGGVAGSFYLDDLLVVESQEINRLCPGMGKQATLEGIPIAFSDLSIEKNVNDTLIVNIDSFGDVVVKLPAEDNLDPYRLRYFLERSIASLDIGGYPYSEVDYTDGKYKIRSGSYSFISSVVVKKHLTSSLSDDLGFTVDGSPVGTTSAGRPHAKGFEFINTYRATTYDLTSLVIDKDNSNPILQNPKNFSTIIGQQSAGYDGTAVKLDGRAFTVIDFYNRANSDGRVSKILLHGNLPRTTETIATGSLGVANGQLFDTGVQDLGALFIQNKRSATREKSLIDGALLVIDEPGYEGNGEYVIESLTSSSSSKDFSSSTKSIVRLKESISLPFQANINWSIITVAKVKHLRPTLNDKLDVINEVSIGIETADLLYTENHTYYEIEVDWDVQRGDYIGVYNATDLFVGNNVLQVPDAMYITVAGDILEQVERLDPPEGEGIKGIGIVGTSISKDEKAIYDIDLGSLISIEAVEIEGQEQIEDLEYNILAAVGHGVSVSVDTHGLTHNHLPIRASNGIAELFTHPNLPYNIFALTDGIQFPKNGLIGTHEADDSRATYFYVDGDGEWYYLEFPTPTWIAGTGQAYNFKDDAITFSLTANYAKSLHRMRIFFKEFPSFMGYQIEYLVNPGQTFDGSKTGYRLIGGFEDDDIKFEILQLDEKLYEREIVVTASGANPEDTHVHISHFDKKYDVYDKGAQFSIPAKRKFDAALYHPYRVLDKSWEPITTNSINLYSFYHYSTKISEIELYSKTSSESDLEDIVDLYYSEDGEFFHRADAEQIEDDILRFVIGNPARYLRLVVNPFSTISLDRILILPDSDLIRTYNATTNLPIRVIDTGLYKGAESPPQSIKLVNKTGSKSDLALSIETKELYSNVVLKTSLESGSAIKNPEFGPPGQVILDEGFDLPVVENIAMNAECYGLKNVAVGKKYYILDELDTESDLFPKSVDLNKWEPFYTNYPQNGSSRDITNLTFPGFQMIGDPPGSVYPLSDMVAKLISRWYTNNSFTATIRCTYDVNGGKTDDLGSELGIRDATGREISIRRSRTLYASGGLRSWADYIINDSATGNIDTKRIFCAGNCGTQFGEDEDANVPYELKISYVNDFYSGERYLRFYFNDSLNFDGVFQWDGEYDELNPEADLGLQVDLDILAPSLVLPLKVFIKNRWGNVTGTATGTPTSSKGTYVSTDSFKFSGTSSYVPDEIDSFSYGYVGSNGLINVGNLVETYANEPVKRVALDLGKRYSIDLPLLKIYNSNYGNTSLTLWNLNDALYSSTETEDVRDVVWGDADVSNIRWILFQALTTESAPSEKYLHSVRVYPDIVTLPDNALINSEWDSLSKIFTDGNYNNTISQIQYPVIAIRLANQFHISNYKLLSREGFEYLAEAVRSSDFTGWRNISNNFYQTQGFTNTDDPRRVVWRGWDFYPTTSLNKGEYGVKWFAFKNTLLSLTNPLSQVQRIAEFQASTNGINSHDVGQQVDRVDFTEYAEWFDTSLKSYVELAGVGIEDLDANGYLYGSSEVYHPAYGFGDEQLGPASLYDGINTTDLLLNGANLPVSFYRVFGTLSGTGDTENFSGLPDDEEGSETDGTITGVTTVLTIEPQQVNYVEIEVSNGTSAVPDDLEIQYLIGEDPEVESNWITISGGVFTGVSEAFGVFIQDPDTGLQSFETQGRYFRYDLTEPITVSGLRIVVTSVEEVGGNFNILNMNSFRVYQEVPQDTTNRLLLENDPNVRSGGRRSLKITYSAGASGLKKIVCPRSFNLVPDPKWSIQDFLSFYMKIQNISELSLEDSYIRLGRDSEEYYEWGFDQIEGLEEGDISNYLLRFRSAQDKGGDPEEYERTSELSEFNPKTDFRYGEIEYFEIGIMPNVISTSAPIVIWIDNFTIKRENFTLPGLNHNTLYLTNGELVYFPLTGFDMRKGYIELTITPDWNYEGFLEAPDTSRYGDQVYTIFSIVNGADEYMGLYYTSREKEGLRLVINTDYTKKDLIIGQVVKLDRYTEHLKIGLLWDNEGKRINARSGATARVYLDDILIGDLILPWEIIETKDTYFLIGSRAYAKASSSLDRQFREFGFNVEIRPVVNSLNGGAENLLILSDPVKLDFDKIITLRDKILISLDGISYFPGNSPDLPLIVQNVPADGEVTFYIKTDFPADIKNMPREGFVKARWLKTK